MKEIKQWQEYQFDLYERVKNIYNYPDVLYYRPSVRFVKYLDRRLSNER